MYNGYVHGYAAYVNYCDLDNDVLLPGCFNVRRYVRLLDNHDPSREIGRVERVQQDSVGLSFLAKAYDELYALPYNGLSIGFKTVDSYRHNGVRYIRRLDVWEISLVLFPMQPLTRANINGK